MDYEKKYKEALEKARSIRFGNPQSGTANTVCEEIFPELKESEDEQVSEEFINALGTMLNDGLPDMYIVSEERVKKSAELLFSIARKQLKNEKPAEWTAEDEEELKIALNTLEKAGQYSSAKWLKNVFLVPQTTQKSWSEEDEKEFNQLLYILQTNGYESFDIWLKSLKDRITWKPSEEMLEALYRAIPENVMEISEDEMLLDKLYQGLKYGSVK